ncbi:DNA polymerase alpha-associated DNA helicase A [Choanephora cucurbitarum]|uniref:DNA polymerase alpha-associated DNA helicase A n=1 Tax=Choanephora cucurbitarum TaxID=101091 RepID=A0A1C7NAC8_9FUNG|nr:DNA polymerase alpha-associated DNA helicase A [Choanephora cucurbitarum]
MVSKLIKIFKYLLSSNGASDIESFDDQSSNGTIQDPQRSQDYIQHLIELTRKESEQEKPPVEPLPVLVKKGIAVCNLKIKESQPSVAGLHKLVLGLERTIIGKEVAIPPHKITKGNIVSLSKYNPYSNSIGGEIQATVAEVKKFRIHLILYNDFDSLPSSLMGACQMMLNALYNLKIKDKLSSYNSLASVLLEKETPILPSIHRDKLIPFDWKLNKYQKEAASFAIASPEIALIHGPPGNRLKTTDFKSVLVETGKTQTLVEVIRQLHKQRKKILVSGPSNVAVDNLMERIAKHKDMDIIRVGNLARVSQEVIPYCLDKLAPKDSQKREMAAELVSNADVIFSTLSGAGCKDLNPIEFDVIIIDEASQATEPDCWVALLKGKKAILAGDHLQLAPTVLSTMDNAVKEKGMSVRNTLSYSLFDRMLDTYGDRIKRMLEVQYRMNTDIMYFSSANLYNNKLVAHPSVEDHRLHELQHVVKNDDTTATIALYDTSSFANAKEQKNKQFDDGSYYNLKEVSIIVDVVHKLLKYGVKKKEVGIITPYSAQVRYLQDGMGDQLEEIEVGSVDGFQGREKEVIVLSMVRSNERGQVGFLSEKRRLNVAITRAKRQLIVVGNMRTLKGRGVISSQDNGFISKWAKWLTDKAEEDSTLCCTTITKAKKRNIKAYLNKDHH